MVVALGPGRFYGSSLPRPRIYTDVKLNDERVDPPVPVTDPLMQWALEAHWSMGGLSFTRHRLQGRIEGNVERLRKQREEHFEKTQVVEDQQKKKVPKKVEARKTTTSPPPAPLANKRRRLVGLVEEEEEEEVNENEGEMRRGAVRKLGDDFERVARESGMKRKKSSPVKDLDGDHRDVMVVKTRSKGNVAQAVKKKRKLVKGGKSIGAKVVAAAVGLRSSPRLSKLGGSR